MVSGKVRIWIQLCVVTFFPPYKPTSPNWKLDNEPKDQWDSSFLNSFRTEIASYSTVFATPTTSIGFRKYVHIELIWTWSCLKRRHLHKDTNEEESVIHIWEECYKQREEQVQRFWGRKMVGCIWGTARSIWLELWWKRKQVGVAFGEEAKCQIIKCHCPHFKKTNSQEHVINRLCFTRERKHD